MAGGFVELLEEHVADTRLQKEGVRHALAADFVADDVEHHRRIHAFARHGDLHGRAVRTFQQVGDFGRIEIIGRLIVDFDDHVAGAQAGFIRGRTDKRRHHDGLAVAALHRHSDAVIVAALIFAQGFEILRIEEVRVRIERPQHLRNRALVDRFIGVDGIGEVFLDGRIDLRELLHARLDVVVGTGGGSNFQPRTVHSADYSGAEN